MKRETYYIVEFMPDIFADYTGAASILSAAHYSYSEARRIYKGALGKELPSRFPRIIKVTTEYKNITRRR